jgi:hypothetical protein
MGVNPLPAWEPSQNGCVEERPQVQKWYSRSASSSIATGVLFATIGFFISSSMQIDAVYSRPAN